MAESRPERRNTVRVLFYGQSITEQRWSREVERDLRARFPHAHLVIENRALGGFSSQLLVKAAETDLYPFYPDLLIFHVYGAHDRYADIVRRVRERTTAEILLQTDHLTDPEELHEEEDPARLPLGESPWPAFMNHAFLPQLADTYVAALCDQRAVWKRYVGEHGLVPRDLLADEVHLNAHGEWLMAECVKDCLARAPSLGPSPAEDWVRTYEVGRDVDFQDGVLRLSFVGNRVDAIAVPGARSAPAPITIDGRPPSAWPELYGVTRAQATPGGKWPPVFDITAAAPLVLEQWTLEVTTESRDPERYRFTLHGSRTGHDGEGRSDAPFVSASGRVVIEPDDWVAGYAFSLAHIDPVPDHFSVRWEVVPRFVDDFEAPTPPGPGIEPVVTLAQGLPPGEHTLEIHENARPALRALRVYTPMLAGASAQTEQ